MKFITLSQKQVMHTTAYTSIRDNHILISIRNPGLSLDLPKSPYCKATLVLNFEDKEDIAPNTTTFDADMAKQILDFVNAHCHKAGTIVVHCYAGVSRSVAVSSALSKILNHKDDNIYSIGTPNMLVYLTILQTYFSDKFSNKTYPAIHYHRNESLKACLTPIIYRIHEGKIRERQNYGVEEELQ